MLGNHSDAVADADECFLKLDEKLSDWKAANPNHPISDPEEDGFAHGFLQGWEAARLFYLGDF